MRVLGNEARKHWVNSMPLVGHTTAILQGNRDLAPVCPCSRLCGRPSGTHPVPIPPRSPSADTHRMYSGVEGVFDLRKALFGA